MQLDLARATWRKSTRSNDQGWCVEVADNVADVIGVRDSKDIAGPVLAFNPANWSAFVGAARSGAFDG
ncbi:DUF397 domain-containing protein [Micromonospora sp. NBC_01699]|uniref:DUF397 domain-containing protein n=1 Tax=Micromonospora sp. NBC_01699 TaxID=2975984 RepID=UPI002E2C7BED|nr:DUF397 domain-containing protein [Micromonospora sp. NBC_01699]